MPRTKPLRMAAVAALASAAALAAIGIKFDLGDREARRLHTQEARASIPEDPLERIRLPEVRQTGVVAPEFLSKIPFDLSDLTVADKKRMFLKIMLPLVARENARIREERKRVTGKAENVPDGIWEKYKVEDGDLERLRRRVDVIPASLVLAQAALESGWGTSRFARKGNNLFGMRTYNPETPGFRPKKAAGFKVIKYESLMKSVHHYMLNLNTHPAYKDFRVARAHMRENGRDPDSRHLTKRLQSYSEIPDTYGELVRRIIKNERLEDFDGLRLAQGGSAGS